MEFKEIQYFASDENGGYVEKDNITSIVKLSGYKFILKIVKLGNYDFHWSFIDENETEITLRDRNFECVDIADKRYNSGFTYKNFKIRDIKKQTFHDFRIDPCNVDSIKQVLLPALSKMNDLGSWANYDVFLQKEALIKENVAMQDTISVLRKELEKISNENKSLIVEIADLKQV